MRGALLILRKDLRLLVRSPGLAGLLVLYPLLVGLLVVVALQAGERTPAIAVVNLDDAGRTVEVGGERLSVDDYIGRLADEADVLPMSPDAAADALESGRVDAVLTIPADFVADLQSGLRAPVLTLATSPRSPIEAQALARRLEAAVFRLNQRLAEGYVAQVVALVDLVVHGGRLGVFGRTGDALGLVASRELVVELQEDLRAGGDEANADRLDPLIDFIDATRRNLDLAGPASDAIRAPIDLEVGEGAGGRDPLTAFGVAGALLMSLGLAGVLLGAAALAGERDDNVLGRLSRGLVPGWALVAAKAAYAAIVCAGVGAVLVIALALSTDLAVDRWALWPVALILGGLGAGALGTVAGAIARDARTALLGALMVALPLLALALLPGAVATGISAVTPFGPAFDLFQGLLVDPRMDAGRTWAAVGRLALVSAVLGAVATGLLARRARD